MRWESLCSAEGDAPADAVWDAIVDGRRWAFWNDRFEWMWLEGPLERGAVATLKPRRYRQTAFVVKEVEPPRRLRLETSFGPVARVALTFEVQARAAGARVTHQVLVDGPLGGLALRMIGRRLAAGWDAALPRLIEYAAGRTKEEAR